MFSSHSYPYQFGDQQQQQQQPAQPPAQYSQYTPQPSTYPLPQPPPAYQPPSYPHPQSQSRPPPAPSPTYPHPQPSQPPTPPRPPPRPSQRPQQLQPPPGPGTQYPSPYSSPQQEIQPVAMPLLQRPPQSDPSPAGTTTTTSSSGIQEIGDPRFVLLLSMSTEELTGLLDDEEKFNEVFNNMEELKQKKLKKEMTMAENRSLADFNLSREPRLTEGRAQLLSRLHKAQQLMDSYTVGKGKLDSLRQQNSLDTALALMQTATANAEEESEEVADNFLKGDLSLEDFLETFMAKRQTAHLRHIKSEKMQEMLTKQRQGQSRAAVTPNSAAPPYPSHQQQVNYQPYSYQPQRPAPRPPIAGPRYGPGAMAPRMPTLGSYPQ